MGYKNIAVRPQPQDKLENFFKGKGEKEKKLLWRYNQKLVFALCNPSDWKISLYGQQKKKKNCSRLDFFKVNFAILVRTCVFLHFMYFRRMVTFYHNCWEWIFNYISIGKLICFENISFLSDGKEACLFAEKLEKRFISWKVQKLYSSRFY